MKKRQNKEGITYQKKPRCLVKVWIRLTQIGDHKSKVPAPQTAIIMETGYEHDNGMERDSSKLKLTGVRVIHETDDAEEDEFASFCMMIHCPYKDQRISRGSRRSVWLEKGYDTMSITRENIAVQELLLNRIPLLKPVYQALMVCC